MIQFNNKEQAIKLRHKAIEMLEVGSISFNSKKFDINNNVDVAKWENALSDANTYLNELAKKEIDSLLGLTYNK